MVPSLSNNPFETAAAFLAKKLLGTTLQSGSLVSAVAFSAVAQFSAVIFAYHDRSGPSYRVVPSIV